MWKKRGVQSVCMRWHASNRRNLGVILIPTDLIDMKHIEDTSPKKIKDEVRNLRLSIALDGVNMYSLQKTNYFFWLVVVFNNNFPPWFLVKNEHLMLALIVLGRRQVKKMDFYVQLLIDIFNKLWDGIHVYNVSRPIQMERSFTLYVICA